MTTYALANPLTVILDKPKEDFTREDFCGVIQEKQIERITFHYTALDGKLKELRLPVANRQQAERILADGERVDGSSLFQGLVDVAVSDLYVVPVYRTAFLNPFDDHSLDFICRYATPDGQLAPFAPDNILSNAYRLFRESTGNELYALGELEFFLLRDPERRAYLTPLQRGYHASAPFLKSGGALDEMLRAITRLTGAVKYAHSEVGCIHSVDSHLDEIRGKAAEQLEIEFLPAPMDVTGDNLMLARWLIRNIAYRQGCIATFAPKLEEGVAGNGLHVHLEARQNGHNVMTGAGGKLSDTARQLIGGLCKHASVLSALGNTVAAAYLRLVPNQEAPTRVCWSDLNRSTMVRVPLAWAQGGDLASQVNPQQAPLAERERRQTVELRTPDGSALIHLLLAGITMAAQWGLTQPEALKLADDLYVTGNIFQNQDAWTRLDKLPGSCVESARILLQQRSLYEREGIFPSSIIDYVAGLLQAEDDERLNQRLAGLSAHERLVKTREIMHKDLHRH